MQSTHTVAQLTAVRNRQGDDYQLWAASSFVTCRYDCGLLSGQAIFRGGDHVPRS